MSSRGLPAPGSKKIKNRVEKESKSGNVNSFSTFVTLFRLCFQLFVRAPQKGPEKWCRAKIVEKCRKTFFDDFLTIFDVFRPARRLPKSVEKLFDTFWRFLTFFDVALSAGPFCNPLILDPGAGRSRELIFNSVSNFGPEGPKNSSGGIEGSQP